jgi:hypothetical protein
MEKHTGYTNWDVNFHSESYTDIFESKLKKKNLGSIHEKFLLDKVALWQVFLRVLRFSPVNYVPPVLH